LFTPEQAAEGGDPDQFYEELEREVGLECQRIGGSIEKLTVFRDSPVGAIAVKFSNSHGAEACKEALHGRWFDLRRIECEYFDGITNYKVSQDEDDDEQKRLEDFGKWLESN
jgi:HIV Tat-specific factor 1